MAVPGDLAAALGAVPAVEAAFAGLSFTRRRECVESVESARRDETRRRRIERIVAGLGPPRRDA